MSHTSLTGAAPFAIEPDARRACFRARFEPPSKVSSAITATSTAIGPPPCPRPPCGNISDLNPPLPGYPPLCPDLTHVTLYE